MFTLIIEDKQGVVVDEYSFEDGEFIIGRSHQADIVLQSDNVSRRHARLFTQEGRCFIEDLKAANGIWLAGRRIYNVTELPKSSQLRIGDFFLHLEGASLSGAVAAVVYARLVPMPGSIGLPADLAQATVLVGRGKDCGVVLHDVSVSRIHAKLSHLTDGSVAVEDLRSSNGTFVNDRRVEQQVLAHGDRLRFGTVAFSFQLQDAPPIAIDDGAQAPNGNRLIPPPPSQRPWPATSPSQHRATAAEVMAPSALLEPPRSVLPQVAMVAVIAVAAVCLIVLVGIVYEKWTSNHADAAAATPAPATPAPLPPASTPIDRGQFDSLLTRGQDAVARRQWDEAQDLFEKARRIDTIHPRPTEALNLINKEKRNGARFSQAEASFAKKDFEGAIQANKSISQDSVYRPDANTALEAIAGLLEMDGDAACIAKDWLKCQNLYLTAISTDFAKPEVNVKYGKAMKKHR